MPSVLPSGNTFGAASAPGRGIFLSPTPSDPCWLLNLVTLWEYSNPFNSRLAGKDEGRCVEDPGSRNPLSIFSAVAAPA